jgi:hypothetical protein
MKSVSRLFILALSLLGFPLAFPAQAANPACSFVGVFSNLAVGKETGDFSGDEIIITLSPQGHEAIYTNAQGNFPVKPVVADTVVKDGWISFSVVVYGHTVNVKAKPSCKYLDASFDWGDGAQYSVKLPKTRSFWDTSGK